MIRRRLIALLLAAGGAIAMLSVSPSPAFASGSVCNSDRSACVEFVSKSDEFIVHDYAPDGYSTVGVIWFHHPKLGWMEDEEMDANGFKGRPDRAIYNAVPGTSVAYKACLINKRLTKLFRCGKFHWDKAG